MANFALKTSFSLCFFYGGGVISLYKHCLSTGMIWNTLAENLRTVISQESQIRT